MTRKEQIEMQLNRQRKMFGYAGKPGYSISAKTDSTEVFIYDEIGFFGISASEFVKDLRGVTTERIDLRLNTPGGAVFDGHTIFNALKEHPAKVVSHIDSLAASIGSIIALAGDEVRMARNAFIMIHEPWSFVIGPADDMRKEADLLDKMSLQIADVYAERSTMSLKEALAAMAAETWFTASEAKDVGFVDAIAGEAEASARFDLSTYENVPEGLSLKGSPEVTERELERCLRDAGLSRAEAKAVLARGLTAIAQRDADDDLRATVLGIFQHNESLISKEVRHV